MTRTLTICCLAAILTGSTAISGEPDRDVRLGDVALYGDLPSDLVEPEGRSRWDLSGLQVVDVYRQSVSADSSGGLSVRIDGGGDLLEVRSLTDPSGGDAVNRWVLPHRFGEALRPGARQTLELVEATDLGPKRLSIRIETVGIGWVHLPARPHEVALQRALILREPPSGRGLVPDRLIHRWVDTRFGIVAEISGPVSPDGQERLSVNNVYVMEEMIAGADPMRVYLPELDQGVFGVVTFRRDRGATTVPEVSANAGVTDMISLVNQGVWDFNIPANLTGDPVAQSRVALNSFETCNMYQCGYFPGIRLGRRDASFGTTSLVTNNQISEVVLGNQADPANDPTMIWLLAGAQKEGVSGSFGSGESRFCYTDKWTCAGNTDIHCRDAQDCVDAGTTGPCNFEEDLTESPLWRLPHYDGVLGEWYLENGDPMWSSGVFGCEQSIYNQICGASGVFDLLWAKDCTGHTGTQSGEIVTEGVATLPSGHTVNTLVVRTVADFCVFLGSGCSSIFQVDEVRTAVYLWQAPYLSSVALLQSEQNAANVETFANLDEASFAVGLFPPVTITVDTGSITDTSIPVSWDPGNDLLGITDFVVYWDTDSGSSSDYDNSMIVPSSQTTATLNGLDPGTEHFITVTARSDFSPFPPAPFCRLDYETSCTGDVDCGDNGPCVLQDPPRTTYESIRFPTTVSGDPDHIYPIEVQATTTGGGCIPQQEIANVMLDKVGTDVEFCWDENTEPCTVGYEILGSATAPGGFASVGQTAGLETCWTGNPSETFFKVVARGTGGNGP